MHEAKMFGLNILSQITFHAAGHLENFPSCFCEDVCLSVLVVPSSYGKEVLELEDPTVARPTNNAIYSIELARSTTPS